jgi:hypothetical protein
MDQGVAVLGAEPGEPLEGLRGVRDSILLDAGSHGGHRHELFGHGVLWHDHHQAGLRGASRPGRAQRRVARADRDQAGCQLLGSKRAHTVPGAAHLERARDLETLGLEPETGPHQGVEHL